MYIRCTSANCPTSEATPATTVNLPTLSDGAAASEVLAGKEALDGSGARILGTLTSRAFLVTGIPYSTSVAATSQQAVLREGSCSDATRSDREECETAGGTWTPNDLTNRSEIPSFTTGAITAVTSVVRGGFVDCGTTGSIEARIEDCALVSKNGEDATWPKAGAANSLEFSTWKLVSRIGANKEVWRDERTGYLWSSQVANVTWCRATGNQENAGGVDCSANTESACAEDGVLTSSVAGEDFGTGTYATAKGGMGRNTDPSVRWRVPTADDTYLAVIHGIRHVVPDGNNDATASYYPTNSAQTVFWPGNFAYTNPVSRTSSVRVRCIGR